MRNLLQWLKFDTRTSRTCIVSSGKNCLMRTVIIPQKRRSDRRVVAIGSGAFRDNTRITRVIIPEGVTDIDDRAFKGCTRLKTVVLPSTLQCIGKEAFSDCCSLVEICMSSPAFWIQDNAFADCHKLEKIDLSHATKIDKHAFLRCRSLAEVTLNKNMHRMELGAFADTPYYDRHLLVDEENGLCYLNGWIVECRKLLAEYTVRADTVGIAPDVFEIDGRAIYRNNPAYDKFWQDFWLIAETPDIPLPKITKEPQYHVEALPFKLRYQGSLESWEKIYRPNSLRPLPATLLTTDTTVEITV